MRTELTDEERRLIEQAREAAASAWAPYSRFRVGAVVVGSDGRVYRGANVENASYGLTVCAERVATFRAVVAGARPLRACAVSCVDAGPALGMSALTPCGACRQVLQEHLAEDGLVLVDGVGAFSLAELLPYGFRP